MHCIGQTSSSLYVNSNDVTQRRNGGAGAQTSSASKRPSAQRLSAKAVVPKRRRPNVLLQVNMSYFNEFCNLSLKLDVAWNF